MAPEVYGCLSLAVRAVNGMARRRKLWRKLDRLIARAVRVQAGRGDV